MPLPEQAHRQLLQLLGMSASPHDGEALNAVRLANQLAARHGFSLIEALETAPAPIDLQRITQLEQDAHQRGYEAGFEDGSAAATEGPPATWPVFCARCLRDHANILRERDLEFLRGFISRGWAMPTERQLPWLKHIAARCGVPAPPDPDFFADPWTMTP